MKEQIQFLKSYSTIISDFRIIECILHNKNFNIMIIVGKKHIQGIFSLLRNFNLIDMQTK